MEQVRFKRARTEEHKRQRAATLTEAARSLALETGVASVTLTAVAERAGVHHSAVRRYFSSHQDILLHLAAASWARWSDTVCEELRTPGPMSPGRLAATLADALAAEPLFCDLLACLPVRLEREVNVEQVVAFKRVCYPAVMSLTDAVERALPALGRQGAVDMVSIATALAGALWHATHPPEALAHAFDAEPIAPPEWDVDFAPTLTRMLTATCVGLTTAAR
ncbi:TetR family transcriptional regulator [Mycobacterium sp. pUA109]|uniref:TetR family transcriptional regulator n=1 Tax=Mycobacterium sp. pUA109 TaxID=3238982 RepID=UPI00351B7B55